MKDSAIVRREAERLYERSKKGTQPGSLEEKAIYFVGGRILDAIALVLKNQESITSAGTLTARRMTPEPVLPCSCSQEGEDPGCLRHGEPR